MKSLRHSSPLFTTLHHSSPGAAYRKICVNLWNLWDIKKVVSAPQPNRASFRFNSVRNPKAKSGEEWYVTLHLSQPQCLSGFQSIWWRVKSKKKSGAFIKKTPDVSFCARQWQIIALVRGNVVPLWGNNRYKLLYASSVLSSCLVSAIIVVSV